MKKTLITSIAAFAIVLSTGTSMAGSLRDHVQRGHVPDVRPSVSQALSPDDGMVNTDQTAKLNASIPGPGFMCAFGGHNAILNADQRCSFDLFPNVPGH